MKNLNALILLATMALSPVALAIEGFDVGITVLTSKTDTQDEAQVDGVILMNYEGYNHQINEENELSIMPTSIEVSVNGEKVKAFTDVATIQYYGFENLELAASALSIEYQKDDHFTVREDQKIALLDLSATKFFAVGSIDLDVTAAASLGGISRSNTNLPTGDVSIKDTHLYTVDLGLGANIPVTDTIDIYLYGGAFKQEGKETEKDGYYAGLEVYGFEPARNITISPYVDYVQQSSSAENRFNNVESSAMNFGIRLNYSF